MIVHSTQTLLRLLMFSIILCSVDSANTEMSIAVIVAPVVVGVIILVAVLVVVAVVAACLCLRKRQKITGLEYNILRCMCCAAAHVVGTLAPNEQEIHA